MRSCRHGCRGGGSSGAQQLWLCASITCSEGQRGLCRVPALPCREIETSRAMTAGGTGLCLLLNEVNMKRSKQWSQGYSSNEVSSGKGEIQLCSAGGRGVTAQLRKHLGQRSR